MIENSSRTQLRQVGAVFIVVLVLLFSFSSPAISVAQDDAGETPTEVAPPTDPVQEPAPPVVPDPEPEAPVIPEPVDPAPEPPVEPVPETPTEPATEVPTEPATETPTEPATETPAPDAPVIPEPVETEPAEPEIPATAEPLPTEIPAPTQTPKPTATTAPVPNITWSQYEEVTCVLSDGLPSGLKYAQSRIYNCEVSAQVSSDLPMPADMQIEWNLNIDFPDSYQLQFPAESPATIIEQLPGATATSYRIAHPWQAGETQNLEFELVVARNTCAIGEQILTVHSAPTITSAGSEATITRAEGNIHPDPRQIVSPVIESASPTIAFDGPITLAPIAATSTGLESTFTTGTANIVVTGDWDPCTTWTVALTGTVDVSEETPAQFRVTSINEEPLPEAACDLSEPCEIIVLPESGDAATPHRYTIGLELELHELTPVGSFGINLQTDVHELSPQP